MQNKTRKKNKKKLKNNSNRIKKGGKVIAAGGFGCIFSPALRCFNTRSNRSTKDNV